MQSKHNPGLVGVYKRLHWLTQKYSKKAGRISCEADVLALFSSSFLIVGALEMPERDRSFFFQFFFPIKTKGRIALLERTMHGLGC